MNPAQGHVLDPGLVEAATTWEQKRTVTREDLAPWADVGLFGLTVPTVYGGAGRTLAQAVRVHRAVAAVSPSLHSLLVVHGMVLHALYRWGSASLRSEVLPCMASGSRLGAFAVTEQESGADLTAVRTRIEPAEGAVLVTGEKRWITFGAIADVVMVLGRGSLGTTCVLVPAGSGQRTRPEPLGVGLPAAGLTAIEFSATRVPAHLVLARPGFGLPVAVSCLDHGRLFVAAGALGVAGAALELAADHAAHTRRGEVRLGEHQLVRALLADASVLLSGATALVEEAASALDTRDPQGTLLAARAKLLASRAARAATDAAGQVLGAVGLVEGHRLTRWSGAARAYQVIEGPTEVLQDLVGGALVRSAGHAAAGAGSAG
jgi:methoxymalonate biosynthesis protein